MKPPITYRPGLGLLGGPKLGKDGDTFAGQSSLSGRVVAKPSTTDVLAGACPICAARKLANAAAQKRHREKIKERLK